MCIWVQIIKKAQYLKFHHFQESSNWRYTFGSTHEEALHVYLVREVSHQTLVVLTQNRLRKAIFVCVVLAESLARFLQFTRDSPQTVTEYNISYTFRHCCLIPPLMISSSPKKSLKLYHWCCSMPEPDADAWRILKSKKLHSTDSSFLVNWCMNSFNR